MAKTLISRPYIFSPTSSRTICCFFLQSRRPFVSQTEVLISKAGKPRSSMFSCNNKKNLKLQIQSDGGVVLNSAFSIVGHRRFTTRATNVNDAGSIDLPLMQSMEKKIKEQLNAESVIVKDASGDGRHVCIDVISSAFEGQSAVNRQRMVYKAIWEELQNTVHAVDQMTTRTPSEAGSQK